jgi:hypothetical protein
MSASPVEDFRAHAEFHAGESATGIGAAVVESSVEGEQHVWNCIVTDGQEWHYVRVVGVGLPPFPNISSERVEEGIERFAVEHFAQTLPAHERLRQLLNANPLHIVADGTVSD